MITKAYNTRRWCFAILSILLMFSACSPSKKQATKAVEQYLAPYGASSVEVMEFVTDPANPNRAYMSVVATYEFASTDGKKQKEYLGYIMTRGDDGWHIQTGTKYTDSKDTARKYLAGAQ